MQKKQFVLLNKGMNRDLSVSKAGESSAYENHNIRITALDHDTLLSVTNERGNREISLGTQIEGTLIGWNVLNEHVILFTHEDEHVDRIYRVDYHPESDEQFECTLLFENDLQLDCDHPIESVVYFESESVQKIYWVDGKNVLRFMNFMAGLGERSKWNDDPTYFDSNRAAKFDVKVTIEKDNSGSNRANGTVQYLLTYFNRHGQETGYVWISDLVYLSPVGRGGSADDTNSNSVKLTISNLDKRFSHFRIYSVFRSSYNGTPMAYLVEENKIEGDYAVVVDDGAHLTAEDASRLLYLGSKPVHANTIEHKDQTLFLGNLESAGHDFKSVENAIKGTMYNITDGSTNAEGGRDLITFVYSDDSVEGMHDIPYTIDAGSYSYESQLQYTSSEITTFKGGEKYRFAIKLQLADGTESPAFWIGDATNTLYPKIVDGKIKRVCVNVRLTASVVNAILRSKLDVKTVQLCIAEATYADRSVKAQGILNPTMFSVWERYNNRIYAVPSWISRPRGAGYANRHFNPVHNSTSSHGEIECNWWKNAEDQPLPFYRHMGYNDSGTAQYDKEYGGDCDYDFLFTVYSLYLDKSTAPLSFITAVYVFKATVKENGSADSLYTYQFQDVPPSAMDGYVIEDNANFKIVAYKKASYQCRGWGKAIENMYTTLSSYMQNELGLSVADDEIIEKQTLYDWYSRVNDGLSMTKSRTLFFIPSAGANPDGYSDQYTAFNYSQGSRWKPGDSSSAGKTGPYTPAYYSKQYMFVDENTVTLNSPEFDHEMVDLDENSGLKLRIVGAAKITSGYSDYTVLATPGKKPGANLIDDKFSWNESFGNSDGLLSWPMWEDRNLDPNEGDLPRVEDRTSDHYHWGSGSVYYWLHMWNHVGTINYFTDDEGNDFGHLQRKVFANLKMSYDTVYRTFSRKSDLFSDFTYSLQSLRQYNYTSTQYVQVNVDSEKEYYSGNVQTALATPRRRKYPILYSADKVDPTSTADSENADLYSSEPIQLEYLSNPHAVMTLPSRINPQNGKYEQTLLPYINREKRAADILPSEDTVEHNTGALLPWKEYSDLRGIPCAFKEDWLQLPGIDETDDDNDMYLFIGELYQEYTPREDTRYGGITESDIANNRFITAGPQFLTEDMQENHTFDIIGNQGDTYFQRWDCLKTKPFSSGSVNNVIDITSVMLETHVNIDGRTDLQRGIDQIASIDTEKFGQINRVYSQPNNYRIERDLDDDANTDAYKASITWTLPKEDLADVDEWTHVTLASSLNLDGDKGPCTAIRRFQNSLIAFQDRGISEILFNSRTQLTTTNGVPVEIANSGRVDGKRYITNHFGCTNKWSIVEGKNGLYFVDNINKAFCSFGGNGISSLSTKLGFDAWFREINTLKSWEPVHFPNIRSFYDKVSAEVYLVKGSDDDMACLVYNENLDSFTSFYDYGYVPMMANVRDRFLSYRDGRMWLQNEGLYCNFFGRQHDFWMQYRVTPNPYSDKIWTNVDYRADFYDVLDENGDAVVPESVLLNGDSYGGQTDTYKENETFDIMRMWDEYQTTGDVDLSKNTSELDPVRKKFRIWRVVVPRALRKDDPSKRTLDRIRNPWVNVLFRKHVFQDKASDLMQLHDLTVTYFE